MPDLNSSELGGQTFLEAQKRSLEMIVTGAPLQDVLSDLARTIEVHSGRRVVASILLLDADGRLRSGAAPTLPDWYMQAIDGIKADPGVGTCAAAAATAEVVLTPDIDTAPGWQQIKQLPLQLGLVAAWSQPIRARDGTVLGTFGTYFREKREPTALERQAVEILSHTAAVAIERTRSEQALRESDRKLQTLVANLPGMVYRCPTTAPWPLTYCSDGVHGLTGCTSAEFMSATVTWVDLIYPDDLAGVEQEVSSALEERRSFEMIYRIRHREGTLRWVMDRGRGVYDEAGAAVAIEGFVGDLTRQREAEEALRKNDRRKDEFIATLSHELRNPLAPLRTALHLLRQRTLGGGTDRLVETMERQVAHLVRLVDDLLEVSRISRGTLDLRRECVSLAAIVRAAVEAAESHIQASSHELHVTVPEDPVWVNGDPVRLTQILTNLLNNAVTYTEPGGRIELHADRRGDTVEIAVRDNGAGIASESIGELFEMFVRGAGHGRPQGGLGIGLALARRLAELHGGTVIGTSQGPGTGSEFIVRLPAADAPAAAPLPAPADVAVSAPIRALVADDNADAANMTSLLLAGFGCEVRTVYDATSAMVEAERMRPDLLLLDIGLPDASGYEVCRRIRSTDWGASVVIVAITGWGQERDRSESARAGFDHHLVKPVEPRALTDLVRQVHSATSARRTTGAISAAGDVASAPRGA